MVEAPVARSRPLATLRPDPHPRKMCRLEFLEEDTEPMGFSLCSFFQVIGRSPDYKHPQKVLSFLQLFNSL